MSSRLCLYISLGRGGGRTGLRGRSVRRCLRLARLAPTSLLAAVRVAARGLTRVLARPTLERSDRGDGGEGGVRLLPTCGVALARLAWVGLGLGSVLGLGSGLGSGSGLGLGLGPGLGLGLGLGLGFRFMV